MLHKFLPSLLNRLYSLSRKYLPTMVEKSLSVISLVKMSSFCSRRSMTMSISTWSRPYLKFSLLLDWACFSSISFWAKASSIWSKNNLSASVNSVSNLSLKAWTISDKGDFSSLSLVMPASLVVFRPYVPPGSNAIAPEAILSIL